MQLTLILIASGKPSGYKRLEDQNLYNTILYRHSLKRSDLYCKTQM